MRLTALLLALAPLAAQAQDEIRTEADGTRTLITQAVAPAPSELVWQLVSTPQGWRGWAATHAWPTDDPDVWETGYAPDARPGGEGNIRQRFVTRDAGRRIVFRTIKTPGGFPHGDAYLRVTTAIELLPQPGGQTRIRIVGSGYPAGAAGDALVDFFRQGNRTAIDALVARAALTPLDFLVGHCWRADLPGGARDTHCFTRKPGAVRDRHDVSSAGKNVYGGETIYGWNALTRSIDFRYVADPGGSMSGQVRKLDDGLDFGTSDFVGSDGTRQAITTRWVRIGDHSYEVRDDSVADQPRRTRFTRVD